MEIKKGIGVSPGVAVSTAIVLDAEDLVIPKRQVAPGAVDGEIERFKKAAEEVVVELALRDDVVGRHGKDLGGIFDFHVGMLRDPSLIGKILDEIRNNRSAAEYAVSTVMRKYSADFGRMTDRYLSERVKDVYDVERHLLRRLIGQRRPDLSHLEFDAVLIAHDILPSQTVLLDRQRVKGFATDVGGRTSHTAIVARAMGIPAVVGLGNIAAEVSPGDIIVIDGNHGVVIINPDEQVIAEQRVIEKRRLKQETDLATLAHLPAQTLDGHIVSLQANIEFPVEADEALRRGAEGVGLYRTEFLYLASETEPSEEEHYGAYADAVFRLKNRPMVIRTLDLGADKAHVPPPSPERNPFLGNRSIRMCLHDIPMFKRQLRAIMRVSILGDVRIMFPMISTLMELRQAKMILADVMEELEDEGISFNREIPVGMMMEVPSAALMAEKFAHEVNFFSIGTNDLIQYTLAVDRTNERVASLFCPGNPAVLKLIRDIIRKGAHNSIGVSMCGEMAGEPLYTLLLLGLGLTCFSMNGTDIPEVKKIIRSTTMEHARQVAGRVMNFDSERQVMHHLREETLKIDPEAF